MKKATDIAKVSAKGGFHLLWGLMASTVISAVGTIFIARLLGSDLYGLYTVALVAPTFIAVFGTWGVNAAMIRYTAQYRAENRTDEIRSIFMSVLVFEFALGLALSVISLAFSDVIAATFYNRPYLAPLIQIASISILADGLTKAATAAFTGIERMELNSIMLVTQSILKTLLVIALVAVGLGTPGAVIGYTISYALAALVGMLLMWAIYKNLPKPVTAKLQIKAYMITLLQYGIPLSLSNIISAAQAQFYILLLPIYYATDNTIIGNYGISQNFVVLISFFATPVTTMLFPAFSKLTGEKDKETLQNFFQYSVKYASLLVVPVAALVMCLAEPAVSTLFGNTYNSAPLFLALLPVTYLYTAFGNLSMGNLILSQGQTRYLLLLTIVTAAIGFPMGIALILSFGVLGLIITSLTASIPSLIIGLMFIRNHYKVTVDWNSSVRILLSSATAAIITFVLTSQLGFASWIRLSIGVVIFVALLLPTILLSRAITRSDVYNLRELTRGFGPVTKLLNYILEFLEKAMNALRL